MRNLFLTLGLFLLCSFAAASSNIPLVFIHGIKGSELLDASDHVQWISAKQALGLGPSRLSLPLQWDRDVQAKDDLRPGDILKAVTVIPFFFETKIYGPWLQAAESMGRSFYPFAYDWRRDCNETVDRFKAFLQEIKKKHPDTGMQVVAHSMGGLITMAVLNENPELFQSVVFVGVPFRGAIGFLPDVHAGRSTGLNHKLLSWEVFQTFPSVLALLPGSTEALKAKAGTSLPTNLHEISGWKARELGYFAKGSNAPPEFEKYFEKALAQVRRFHDRLTPKLKHYPPVSVIVGKGTPTLQSVIQDGPKAERGWDFTSAPTETGDGRILEKEALPPEGIPFQPTYLAREHADLLSDPEVSVQIVLMGN